MDKFRIRIDYILKHNLIIQRIYKFVFSLLFKIIGLLIKTDDKLILFNAHGRKYNDSPKAIFEYMNSNSEYKNYKFVWALDDPEAYNIPNAVKIKMDTMKYFIMALKAKYWVSCVNIERGLNFKKKQTVYMNTWHGVPLKLVGNAVSKRKDFDFSNVDIFCYSGKYEEDIYIRDFNVLENNLFLTGLPRNDQLYNISTSDIGECKKRLNLPEDKKIILYAPTWRDSKNRGKSYTIAPSIDMNELQRELQEEYVFLLRTHSYTNELLGINFNEFIRDFTSYPEINDLLIVSDILISDYSSVIFDYSILERPIICFAYDYEQYSLERGFYIDLEKELPSGVVRNQQALIKKIKNINYNVECEKTANFKNKYIDVSGNATKMCVEKLFK